MAFSFTRPEGILLGSPACEQFVHFVTVLLRSHVHWATTLGRCRLQLCRGGTPIAFAKAATAARLAANWQRGDWGAVAT